MDRRWRNDFNLARTHFQRATELAGEHDVELMAHALSALGSLNVISGDTAGGLRLATDAIASAERSPLRMSLVMALIRAAETALLAADRDEACRFLADGIARIAELGTERYLGDCCELVALLQLARGDPWAAVMFGASSAVHEKTGGPSKVRFIAKEARAGRHRLADLFGTERLESYERKGRNLSLGQIIDHAQSCVEPALYQGAV
jgi:hypothetical protein